MALKVADNDELVGWILSFGGQLKIINPADLRKKVQAEASAIVALNR